MNFKIEKSLKMWQRMKIFKNICFGHVDLYNVSATLLKYYGFRPMIEISRAQFFWHLIFSLLTLLIGLCCYGHNKEHHWIPSQIFLGFLEISVLWWGLRGRNFELRRSLDLVDGALKSWDLLLFAETLEFDVFGIQSEC